MFKYTFVRHQRNLDSAKSFIQHLAERFAKNADYPPWIIIENDLKPFYGIADSAEAFAKRGDKELFHEFKITAATLWALLEEADYNNILKFVPTAKQIVNTIPYEELRPLIDAIAFGIPKRPEPKTGMGIRQALERQLELKKLGH